jgi:hypothetical protein
MELLLSLVLATLLSALAVKHVADILLYGSIFQPLRSFIAKKETENTPFFGTLNQLFTCLLCMSTQVAVWLAGVPASIIAWMHFGDVWVSLFVLFVATMAVATLGMGLWTLLEYSPNRFHARGRELDEANRKVRELTLLLRASANTVVLRSKDGFEVFFGKDEYFSFLDATLAKCKNIGCSIRRHFCHSDRIKDFYVAFAEMNPEVALQWPMLENALYRLSLAYIQEVSYFQRSESEIASLKEATYQELLNRVTA